MSTMNITDSSMPSKDQRELDIKDLSFSSKHLGKATHLSANEYQEEGKEKDGCEDPTAEDPSSSENIVISIKGTVCDEEWEVIDSFP